VKEDEMEGKNRVNKHLMGIFLILGFVVSCATIPELKVNYRLPLKSEDLRGKKVFLAFEDARKSKDLIGKGAQEDFQGFSGNVSLSLARGDEPGFRMGVYTIPSLFMEVFKRRLENLGIEVVSRREGAETQLAIVLEVFLLDLVDRKWVVTMGYEARLMKNGQILAKQMISGQAERLKLVGRGDADKVMEEIFTDMVNRLDVPRLFKQAGLI